MKSIAKCLRYAEMIAFNETGRKMDVYAHLVKPTNPEAGRGWKTRF